MSSRTARVIASTRELLAEAQERLWIAMYYVRLGDVGITDAQVKRAIQCVEKLQAQLNDEACS